MYTTCLFRMFELLCINVFELSLGIRRVGWLLDTFRDCYLKFQRSYISVWYSKFLQGLNWNPYKFHTYLYFEKLGL